MKEITIHLSESAIVQQQATMEQKNSVVDSKGYQPTNGYIRVKAIDTVKAFQLIEEALNAHPDIECDWIDGKEIEL